MKLQHTQGPWVMDYHGTIGHIKTLCNPHVHTKTIIKYRYSMCEEILTEEEIQANARLIAAAPEMLTIVIKTYEDFCHYICNVKSGMQGCENTCESKYKIQQIIEKATGLKIEEVLK